MEMNEILKTVSQEIEKVCKSVNEDELENLAEEIRGANNIYVYGNGRSGLVGKMVAMRLMHSGYNVFVVGETTTPAFKENDLLIILSGSGKGHAVNTMTEKVKSLGGQTALVTASGDASLKSRFDALVFINASTKNNDIPTIQPLGNQFDQSMHLILDALIIFLNEKTEENKEEIKARHFNLE
ncbi:3-hexulose-6-phosphate isomerase [Salinicoccus halodurans]|uniref:3-hexulose-6-phosphate isomerase n=2 Tax=Salinicoccus halodurans TaxID=407035 RepID=A0AA94HGY4_9STAP|nr:6-phospho-3-hexuloisomerase [Salinicoccus halodurans]SFK87970.1 3-hexulose-6-phosphate isomerase [Salinicoccus halodurans]